MPKHSNEDTDHGILLPIKKERNNLYYTQGKSQTISTKNDSESMIEAETFVEQKLLRTMGDRI